MPKRILILNGPNLNLLGERESKIYGSETLRDIHQRCSDLAQKLGLEIAFLQSNHEGQLVDWIHESRKNTNGIIINAGAYTHTSIALLDALNAFTGTVLEVHISNIYKRETFRHFSYISQRADGILIGLGVEGYELALKRMANSLKQT